MTKPTHNNTIRQPEGLMAVLLDRSARADERDDAAMDLGTFDEPEALRALLQVGSDPNEDPDLLVSVGESIGEIWARQGAYDEAQLCSLLPAAREIVKVTLKERAPHLIT
jgi:hypothetical protein